MNWIDDDLLRKALSFLWSDKLAAAVIASITSYFVSKKSIKSNGYQERIKSLCLGIEAVEELGEEYWDEPGKIEHFERKIVSKLQIINDDISELNSRLLKRNDVDQKLINFRQSITGGLFASKNKIAEPGRINQIRESASRLRKSIKLCKPGKYF